MAAFAIWAQFHVNRKATPWTAVYRAVKALLASQVLFCGLH